MIHCPLPLQLTKVRSRRTRKYVGFPASAICWFNSSPHESDTTAQPSGGHQPLVQKHFNKKHRKILDIWNMLICLSSSHWLVWNIYIYIIYHISNKWNHQPAYVFFTATHVISGVIFPFFYCLSGCLTGRLLQGVSQQDPKKLQEQLGTFDAFLSHMEIGESYGNWINYGKHNHHKMKMGTFFRQIWIWVGYWMGISWDSLWESKTAEKSPNQMQWSWEVPFITRAIKMIVADPSPRITCKQASRWVIYTVQSHWPQTWMV